MRQFSKDLVVAIGVPVVAVGLGCATIAYTTAEIKNSVQEVNAERVTRSEEAFNADDCISNGDAIEYTDTVMCEDLEMTKSDSNSQRR